MLLFLVITLWLFVTPKQKWRPGPGALPGPWSSLWSAFGASEPAGTDSPRRSPPRIWPAPGTALRGCWIPAQSGRQCHGNTMKRPQQRESSNDSKRFWFAPQLHLHDRNRSSGEYESNAWCRADVLQHQPFLFRICALTILLQSTAPSALSLRSGSVCAPLLMGKMLPADRGRFFRPYGAELMHAHPPPKTHRAAGRHRDGDAPPVLWKLLCPLWRREWRRRRVDGLRWV